MILETERLILRPWMESDAPELYRHAKDPLVGPAAGWMPHTSEQNSLELIRSVLSAEGPVAVVHKSIGQAIGSISVMRGDAGSAAKQTDETEIGYWIGREYWGHGLIPEAVRELLRYCFVELGCSGVWCGYYEGNEKSRRVQEKCGFLAHHRIENTFCERIGEIRTEYFTYLSRTRWQERNEIE